jgi:hypothetical protein
VRSEGRRGRRGPDVLRLKRAVASLLSRGLVLLGHEPNVAWLHARLSRAVALDRARAHIAISELERCLLLRRTGVQARCFGAIRA